MNLAYTVETILGITLLALAAISTIAGLAHHTRNNDR